jgi:hypothetical protein
MELDAIESALRHYRLVRESAVLPRETVHRSVLVGFLRRSGDRPGGAEERARLSSARPDSAPRIGADRGASRERQRETGYRTLREWDTRQEISGTE